ncbi:hypothetical protein [Streptomyces sp. NPDC006134]|uniref:hypothetical protein n=1 Tax=Streptomyces sp. NPDC006134 TaxID=3154467 RepID=UPI0033FA9339
MATTFNNAAGLRTLPVGAVFTDAEGDTAVKAGEDEFLVTGVGAPVTSLFFAFPVTVLGHAKVAVCG